MAENTSISVSDVSTSPTRITNVQEYGNSSPTSGQTSDNQDDIVNHVSNGDKRVLKSKSKSEDVNNTVIDSACQSFKELAESEPHEEPFECVICLQPCVHPVKLPCSHIFCYLCVKGVVNCTKTCALCRSEIPRDYVDKPTLVRNEDILNDSALEDGTQWFYSGNNTGWWRYDPRTNRDIEEKHQAGVGKFDILIAGFIYVIDLEQMVQYRKTDSRRKRTIKRDQVDNVSIKGVAGLLTKHSDSVERKSGDGGGSGSSDSSVPTTPVHSTTRARPDIRNNNRALLLRSALMQLSPAVELTPRSSPPSRTSSTDNEHLISGLQNMQLDENNPYYFIPRRGSSDSAVRRRRRRERESFTSLRRINTDSEESD